MREILQVFIKN